MGVWTSAPFLVMSVVIIGSGFLSDYLIRRGNSEITVRKTFIVIGLVLCMLIVPAGMVDDRMTSVWLLAISLCGLGVASPNTWTLTQAVCSKTLVGTVSGIQNFGGNLGGIIAPFLTGYIADKTDSFELAFVICGVLLVVGMFAYIFLIGPKAFDGDSEPETVTT
jgi:MFS family permease